ncbi:MAG: hypothetical protein AAFZ89_09365 [Bacteroidota bacterium]
MKYIYILLFASLISLHCNAQQLYRLQWENYQQTEVLSGALDKEINLHGKNIIVTMGGLNDLDGAGNYLNMYGNTLIIDSLDILSDGTRNVVLRREDGKNFFNLFSTVRARLIPLERSGTSNAD